MTPVKRLGTAKARLAAELDGGHPPGNICETCVHEQQRREREGQDGILDVPPIEELGLCDHERTQDAIRQSSEESASRDNLPTSQECSE